MHGGGTIRNSGHHLTKRLHAHVAYGVYAGNGGFCGFSGDDAAVFQFKLILHQLRGGLAADADKQAVAGSS